MQRCEAFTLLHLRPKVKRLLFDEGGKSFGMKRAPRGPDGISRELIVVAGFSANWVWSWNKQLSAAGRAGGHGACANRRPPLLRGRCSPRASASQERVAEALAFGRKGGDVAREVNEPLRWVSGISASVRARDLHARRGRHSRTAATTPLRPPMPVAARGLLPP